MHTEGANLESSHQASLSITNSQSLFKLMYIESVMPSKFCPRASSAKTRGFHTQLDEGPETP